MKQDYYTIGKDDYVGTTSHHNKTELKDKPFLDYSKVVVRMCNRK